MQETGRVVWRLWLGLSLGAFWMLMAILAALVGTSPNTVMVVFVSLVLIELMALVLVSTLSRFRHSWL